MSISAYMIPEVCTFWVKITIPVKEVRYLKGWKGKNESEKVAKSDQIVMKDSFSL